MPIPERSAGREKTLNVTQVGGSEVLDRNTPIREDRIIRLKTVLARTGLSRSTIYRKIAEGTFPAQLKISVNGAGWRESDINRWIADPVGWRPKGEFDEVR
jgi:prophage regulatory protein